MEVAFASTLSKCNMGHGWDQILQSFAILCFKLLEAIEKDKSGTLEACQSFISQTICTVFKKYSAQRLFIMDEISKITGSRYYLMNQFASLAVYCPQDILCFTHIVIHC